MLITMSLFDKDHIFHASISETQKFVVGDESDADLRISGIFDTLIIGWLVDQQCFSVRYKRSGQNVFVKLDQFAVLDSTSKLSVFFSEKNSAKKTVTLPQDGIVHCGRKEHRKNGERNEIVIKRSFVSSEHFELTCSRDEVSVRDCGSTNGIYVNGKRVQRCVLHQGDELAVVSIRMLFDGHQLHVDNVGDAMTVKLAQTGGYSGVQHKIAALNPTTGGKYWHIRSPRLVTDVCAKTIQLEKPPSAGGEPQINWLNVLVSPMISVVLMLVLVLALGMSPVMLIMSGAMSVVSAILAVTNYRNQKKQHGQKDDLIHTKYREYLGRVAAELADGRKKQLEVLNESNPSPMSCLTIARSRSRRLWERSAQDEDFLAIRLGTGNVEAMVKASYQQSQVVLEENELENEAIAVAENSCVLENAPIVYSLKSAGQIGVTGSRTGEVRLLRNIVAELSTVCAYTEVRILAFVPPREAGQWEWMRWLPHCNDDRRRLRFVYADSDDAEPVLDELRDELSRRDSAEDGAQTTLPHYVFIVAAPSVLEKHGIRKYLLSDKPLGCTAIFVYDKIHLLPKECDVIVHVTDTEGEIYSKNNAQNRVHFTLDPFTQDDADSLARSLAPVYVEKAGGEEPLPASVSFLQGYGAGRPEELNIARRWANARTYKSLSVPIAAAAGGSTFEFDIHEKRHGVMGVVAGMPGSGKTEMVQSWLLSMAVNFSPQDVSFVLIDFKGTGMIAPLRNIPHLAGAISNLDTNVDRNLTAIRSEVHRREALIDQYSHCGVKNINDLNERYHKGIVPERLPVLLVVIDEFAEFRKEFPDFGAEIDSLTSKGRSLGIFVVLMTQKPAGVVSPKTEDNIKFRWCLRVANYSASRAMLGRPDAAKITARGRAFVKVGEDEIFEEIQPFWSGAPYQPGKRDASKNFAPISLVERTGRRIVQEQRNDDDTVKVRDTEIEVVTKYIADYCAAAGVAEARKVWTDALPERISLDELNIQSFDGKRWPKHVGVAPVVGRVDDPATQQQYPLALDLPRKGHTVVYGAPGSGKTTLLKTLAVSASVMYRPDAVNMYIMDFGSWNLTMLRDLPHVGGVAKSDEPERVRKLTQLLSDMLNDRKRKFSQAGVGNINDYRDAVPGDPIPEVILLVDDFANGLKLYQELTEFFVTLTGTGSNYGIYLVATAGASNAVPMKIAQNIRNAVALQMPERSDYTYIVGKVGNQISAVTGRGYVKGNPPLEFQTALPAAGETDQAITRKIRECAAEMRRCWRGVLPAMIPEMPETIPYGSVRGDGIALGLSVDKVAPVCFDYRKQHFLMISGTGGSGKSDLLKVILKQFKEQLGGLLYVYDVKGGVVDVCGLADRYLTDKISIEDFVESLRPILSSRRTEKQANPSASFEPMVIAIDDYEKFCEIVDEQTRSRLLPIIKLAHDLDVYLVVAGDAYGLSSHYNKGQDNVHSMTGDKNLVIALGGCLDDHGAVKTKAGYSEKRTEVGKHEGFVVKGGEYICFRTMSSAE